MIHYKALAWTILSLSEIVHLHANFIIQSDKTTVLKSSNAQITQQKSIFNACSMFTRRRDDPQTNRQTQKTPYFEKKWLFIKPRAIKLYEECWAFFTVSSHCTTEIKTIHLLNSLPLTDRHTHAFKQGSLMKHEKVRPVAARFVMTYFITNPKPGTDFIHSAFLWRD
jgi:hypothetical protein